jgi:LPS-assembly protein
MKNKFINIIFTLSNNLFAEGFEFSSDTLQVLKNGNLLTGDGNVQIVSPEEIIKAEKFEYDKTNSYLKLTGNVSILNKTDNTILYGNRVDYFKNEEKIIINDDVKIIIENKYTIYSDNITYLREKEYFFSKDKTNFNDKNGNKFQLDSFNYYKIKNRIRGKNLIFTDKENNKYFIDDAMVKLDSNEVLGKDLKINFTNSTFDNSKNEPRLKGNKIYSNIDTTKVSKGIFTTCKKTDKCPPWTMQASEVVHDRKKKTISYKNAWLKIYDTPVVYFPKFFHPDPTVKRQSGFLIPKFSSGNTLGNSLEIPYFNVMADNKDLTLTPKIYDDGSLIFQSEYREENKNTSHIFDASLYNRDNVNIFGDSNSKNHFFSNSTFNYENKRFDSVKIELNIESVSNDTYLKTYKIDSPLIKNDSSLNSFVNLELDGKETYLKASIESYEDLTKPKDQRYEFVYPNFSLSREINLDNSYNGNFIFDAQGYQKKYAKSSEDFVLINNLEYDSYDYVTKNGLKNNFNILIKNVNTNGTNSTEYKNESENKLLSSLILESSLPLKQKGLKFDSILKPKASIRFSPTETKNMSNSDRRINIDNIFSNNRIAENDSIEGGQSLTLGTEYILTDKKNDNDYFLFNIATVLRDKENLDLPKNSTLGQKTSDIIGSTNFKPNEYFDINYSFSIDNNFNTTNYDLIKTNLSLNNFVTSFEYLKEDGIIGNKSYLQNKTAYSFDETNSLSFSTRVNRTTNLTEFYNLMYQYKNDCLKAALEYRKEYYNDNDLQAEDQLLFTITIMPFGGVSGPNLYN